MEVKYPNFIWDTSGKTYRLFTDYFPLIYGLLPISLPTRAEVVFENKKKSISLIFEDKKSFENKTPIVGRNIPIHKGVLLCKDSFKQKKGDSIVITIPSTDIRANYLAIYEEEKDILSWICVKQEELRMKLSHIMCILDVIRSGNHVLIYCGGFEYNDIIIMEIEGVEISSYLEFLDIGIGISKEKIKTFFHYIEPHLGEMSELEIPRRLEIRKMLGNIKIVKVKYITFLCVLPSPENSKLLIFEGLTKIIEIPNWKGRNIEDVIASHFREKEKRRLPNLKNKRKYLKWIVEKIIGE